MNRFILRVVCALVWVMGPLGAPTKSLSMKAQAMSKAKPMMVVSCPDVPGHETHLCPALITSLMQAAPDHLVQERAAERGSGSEDLHVTLVMKIVTDHRLIGALEWRTRQGSSASGPEVELSVMDSTIRPGMYRQFTDELIRASIELLSDGIK